MDQITSGDHIEQIMRRMPEGSGSVEITEQECRAIHQRVFMDSGRWLGVSNPMFCGHMVRVVRDEELIP